MPATKQSPCALCDAMAQFEYHDSGRIRYYSCPACHYYAVSETAVRYLKNHPESKAELANKLAGMLHDTQIIEIVCQPAGHLHLVKVARTKYSQ